MIILATISINAVLGEDGLIKQAEKASQMQANAEASDNDAMNIFDKYISDKIGNIAGNEETLKIRYVIEDIDASGKAVKLSYFIGTGEVTAEEIEAKIEEMAGETIPDDVKSEWKTNAKDLGITYEEYLLECIFQQYTGETITEETRTGLQAEAENMEMTYQEILEYILEEYAGISFSTELVTTTELEEMLVELYKSQGQEITFTEEMRTSIKQDAESQGMTYYGYLKYILEAHGIDASGATAEATIGNTNVGVAKSEFIATRNGKYTVKAIAKNGMQAETQIEVTGIEEEKFSSIYNTTTTYTDGNGAIATIPAGFAVGTSSGINSIANGLVITDAVDNEGYSIGNEFVWIPVESDETFTREGFGQFDWNTTSYTEPFNYTYEGTKYTGYETEAAEYNTMRTQVLAYNGFYIARYEAGVNSSKFRTGETDAQEVVSKRGVAPYNHVIWGTSMNEIGTKGAVYLSQNMYTGKIQSSSVTSTLIYGVQWDAMCKYIEDYTRTTPTKMGADLTGRIGGDNSKNIYDLAGNCSEWTMEAGGTLHRVLRGAFFGTSNSVSSRFGYQPYFSGTASYESSYSCFRTALYINDSAN